MSKQERFPLEKTLLVRDTCLCLATQRAARALARLFDERLRPLGITSGQFSLLTALSRPVPWRIGDLATFLAMDRTTITANLKPLERDKLISITVAKDDRRSRNVTLALKGHALLKRAFPIWQKTHAEVDKAIAPNRDQLRTGLMALAQLYASED